MTPHGIVAHKKGGCHSDFEWRSIIFFPVSHYTSNQKRICFGTFHEINNFPDGLSLILIFDGLNGDMKIEKKVCVSWHLYYELTVNYIYTKQWIICFPSYL